MAIDDYEEMDATALAGLVRSGEASPDELLDTAIGRLEQVNPKLNCVVIPMIDEARARIAAGLPEGPLRGVPFLLKDLHLLYRGVRTTNGCRLFADHVPDHHSEMVRRYEQAGLVVFGKSASPEFGLSTSTESRLFGRTLNPWRDGITAGGSSGGAASAVAAGVIPAANASDGGGSIRIPASCCGLFGLKPTRGRNPFGPDAGEGWNGMSAIHAVTRSVRDSAALLDAVCAPERGAPYAAPPQARPYVEEVGADPGRLRIALQTRAFNGSEVEAECVEAAQSAATLCRELGHEVVEAELDIDWEPLANATRVVIAAHLRATLEARAAELGRELCEDDVERISWFMVQLVGSVGATDYARAVRVIHATTRRVEDFLTGFDLLLTPTMAVTPPPLGVVSLDNPDAEAFLRSLSSMTAFSQLFNASGNPAASLPLHWSADGVPVGVQLVARFGADDMLLRIGAQLEQAQPWFDRRPEPWW